MKIRTLQKLCLAVMACVLAATSGWAQSALRSSTLSATISDSATSFSVASASGVTAGMLAYVDREAMRITAVSSNTLTVTRGQEGTVAEGHTSGETIWMDSPQYFSSTPFTPLGACTSTTDLERTPLVHTPSGALIRCTNSEWDVEERIGRISSKLDLDLNLNTTSDGRQVELNSRNFTQTSGDSIGFRVAPAQSVTSTGTLFGGQVTPRLNDDIDLANIIGLHVDTYVRGTTAKTLSGDVRALQLELVTDDAATNTVSGDVNAIRIRAAFSATTLTGDMVPIKIEVAETQTNSQQWDAVFELQGANAGIWASGAASGVGDTEDGYFKIIINGVAQYVMTFSDGP